MIDQDTRPTKAQFAAMAPQQRAAHLVPLDQDGNPFPRMSGSELQILRLSLGLSPHELAIKLALRGKNPGSTITRWESGDTKKYGVKAIVPGHVAAKVLAMGDK